MPFFNKPKPLAHLAFGLVMAGLALHSIATYVVDELSSAWVLLFGFAMVLYLAAFPFAVLALMRNWRVPHKDRLHLFPAVEVGVGLLPFFLTIILVIYTLWFAR